MLTTLKKITSWLSARRGLLTLLGIALVIVNFILGQIPALGWLSTSDLFLHLGIVVGLLGLMLAIVLG